MENLKEKTVLVTGSSNGIGRAVAIAFAKGGNTVIVNYKTDVEQALSTVEECNKYSKSNICVKADVSSEEEVVEMLKAVREQFPQIDILVNNAGIFDENDNPLNVDAFENIYRNNFLSCVLVTKHTLPMMKAGKIINMSSVHAKLGYGRPEAIAYSSFKAALENYTKNLAKELAPNILVNAVAPGRVLTPMWGNPDTKEQKELGKAQLIQRMIQPEEIADGVLFMARNNAVCGEVLTIDGGMSLLTLG